MTDFENVIQIRGVAAGARFGKRHITDASRRFAEVFAGNFGVTLPADTVVFRKPVELGIVDGLLADQEHGWFADDVDV